MEKVLYDTYSEHPCGYCQYHKCGITVKQLRKKECLKKQCAHLIKNEEHDIWRQIERKKELRREQRWKKSIAIYQITD